jgi:hypothetical protein
MKPIQARVKFAIICLFLLIFATSAARSQTSAGTKATAWGLGDNLSLAAIAHAEGVQKSAVDGMFAKAAAAGKKFGVTIPTLPVNSGDKIKDKAVALAYLLRKVGGPMGGILKDDFDEEHALLFEISLKSNILLMMYGPGESTTESIANVIKSRSERIGLPPRLTASLLKLIAEGATYEKVKPAVFQMHRDVAAYLKQPR